MNRRLHEKGELILKELKEMDLSELVNPRVPRREVVEKYFEPLVRIKFLDDRSTKSLFNDMVRQSKPDVTHYSLNPYPIAFTKIGGEYVYFLLGPQNFLLSGGSDFGRLSPDHEIPSDKYDQLNEVYYTDHDLFWLMIRELT